MVAITKILVENFRSHGQYKLVLSPTITAIIGINGSGKTSLLEALYITLQGSSFKALDREILKEAKPWWRVEVELDNCLKRVVTYNSETETSRKKITINNKTSCRMANQDKFPVVLFEPEHLRLLNGSPTRRRQFIDQFISQLDPLYLNALKKYNRALKQRNNLLKQVNLVQDDLFTWEMILSEYGAYLIEKRSFFIQQLDQEINQKYYQIAKKKDQIKIQYSHQFKGNIKQNLLNQLTENRSKDQALQYTSVGPHRHDVLFNFNQKPAISVASRGEIRSLVLALKFLEMEIISQKLGQKPVVLLDDVFSELDEERQKHLLDIDYQIIITATKLPTRLNKKIKVIKIS